MSKTPKNKQQQTRQNLAVLATRRFYWFSYNHRFYRRTDNLKKHRFYRRTDNLKKNIDFTGESTTLKKVFTGLTSTYRIYWLSCDHRFYRLTDNLKNFYMIHFNIQDFVPVYQQTKHHQFDPRLDQ